MILIRQNGDKYEVRFKYDDHIVFLIKQCPSKCWVPEGKFWEIDLDKLGFFLNLLKGTPYEHEVQIVSSENIGKDEQLPAAVIPDIELKEDEFLVKSGYRLYSHQKDFLKFAIHREHNGLMSGFIDADDMGLGKTLESINIAHYNRIHYGFKRCLILCCINISKYNWQNDIEDHSNGLYSGYILGSRLNTRGKNKGKLKSEIMSDDKLHDLETLTAWGRDEELPYFIITNVESLRFKRGKHFLIAEKISELISAGELSMVVIDEAHKNLSPSSNQGKQLLKIKKKTESKCMWIPTTGTPIVNSPLDCYVPLRLIDATGVPTFYQWSQEFCIYGGFGGKEVVGYKNMHRLKRMMQNNLIRRLKEDVLDLPPKIQITEYVENTKYQQKLYDEVAEGIMSRRDDIVASLNPLSQFLRLRQVNGSPELLDESIKLNDDYLTKNAKLVRLIELVDEIVERGEKVIVYSNWVEPLRTIYHFLKKRYGTCVYTGTMSEKDRTHQKDIFQHNPNAKVMIGTVTAMGTALTLTCANNVIFYDCPWTMADFNQACDRVHRISTTKTVTVYKLITKSTVDERADNILFRKKGIAGFLVDNIDIHNSPELFDLLLSDTAK
jgi:SNF2 family DNA or RNA helicase|nr:MAG TPA: Chromatin remodeling complex ATPase [Bacteriophage sp.]